MPTQQITDINGIPAQRIRAVIERADAAFWRTIGQGFPEVTAGDFGPDDLIAWESARNRAVCSWLQYNAPRHGPRPISELLAEVAGKLGMEVTQPVGGLYHAHLLAARILDRILAEQNRYEGDEVEIAQRLLEALEHPLAAIEDPAEHAIERLAHVLAFDGPDWHLDTIRVVDALWLASLGGQPHWQQRRETP
jgi:hypothetical protein